MCYENNLKSVKIQPLSKMLNISVKQLQLYFTAIVICGSGLNIHNEICVVEQQCLFLLHRFTSISIY